jgi:hypothetical protein
VGTLSVALSGGYSVANMIELAVASIILSTRASMNTFKLPELTWRCVRWVSEV